MFQFFKPPFSAKITNFTKFAILEPKFTQNFHSRAANLAKIEFFKPYFFPKNQFFKPLFLVPTRSLSPICGPLGYTPIPKWKVSTPLASVAQVKML